MQWTDESGRAYGEQPYGGAGYRYAHPQPTAWDAAYGGVLTAPYPQSPETDTQPIPYVPHQTIPFVPEPEWQEAHWQESQWPEPERDAEPDTEASEPVRPVFVDSSGRRQRRVLRAARLLMIPAGGYVALLVGTLLGGPGISAPFVPQPDTTHPATPRVSAPDAASGTGRRAGSADTAGVHAAPRPTARQTSGPTAASTTPATTAGPTPAPASTTSTTSTSTPTRVSKGRAVGSSHKPVK
ncbi:hypothetical protein ABT288_28145 [Streptomyces sp. NPDC001093]|uniref:hypothetical protein n=1 Tax=Streptomyces sp. NPDC001093 TaxID=3154376 RepID=UPI0033309CA2